MRKVRATIAYVGWGAMLLDVLFAVLQFRELARYFIFLAIYMFIISVLLSVLYPKEMMMRLPGYNERFQKRRLAVLYILNIGTLLFLAGALFRLTHFGAPQTVLLPGICTIIIGVLLLTVLQYTRRSYLAEDSSAHIHLTADQLEKYAGIFYSEQLKRTMTVWVAGEQLKGQLEGQGSFDLAAVKEDVFNCIVYGVVMEFHSEKGELVLIQHGRYLPFSRQ